jgi:hypothetical protein
MCGRRGYVASRAQRDVQRHDIDNYVLRAPWGRLDKRVRLRLVKDPGLLLSVRELRASCRRSGVRCQFLVVWTPAARWRVLAEPCHKSACRGFIAVNWQRCHEYFLASLEAHVDGNVAQTVNASTTVLAARPDDVRTVLFDNLAREETWRAIERWLGLAPLPVSIVDHELAPTTPLSAPLHPPLALRPATVQMRTQARGAQQAKRALGPPRRRLILHPQKGLVPHQFIVNSAYMHTHSCAAGDERTHNSNASDLGPSSTERMLLQSAA